MTEYILGIDIGTSSCKCCAMSMAGNIEASASIPYDILSDEPGAAMQDPEVWYDAAKRAIGKIFSVIGPDGIRAVSVTGQMRGLTFIGEDGFPAGQSILWNDTRCEKEVRELAPYAKMLDRVTYNPVNTMCTLPKILWAKKNMAGIWEKTAKLIFPKDYINLRFTGSIATDHSDASGSSAYDFVSGGWSQEVIDEFGLESDKFPKILKSTEIMGHVSRHAEKETGIRCGTPVLAGGSDATVELVSLGVTDQKQCKIRLGSSCGISTVAASYDTNEHRNHYCWKPALGEGIVLDLNTRFCAQSVKWLRDVFYSGFPKEDETFAEIDRLAGGVAPGAEGLIFHPYLHGEDAPYWDMSLKGKFTGIGLSHTREHFARAVFEGIAFSIKDVLETFPKAYEKCEEYKVTGGGIKSPVWLKIVADVVGKKMTMPKNGDASYGACILALHALGTPRDVICGILEKDTRTLSPDAENVGIYTQRFAEYKKLAML